MELFQYFYIVFIPSESKQFHLLSLTPFSPFFLIFFFSLPSFLSFLSLSVVSNEESDSAS